MNSARVIVNSKMKGDKLVKTMETQTWTEKSEQRIKLNKEKYGKNGGENTSHYTEN